MIDDRVGELLDLGRLQEDSMSLVMEKMWRWVMCGTRSHHWHKEVLFIPNEYGMSNSGPHTHMNTARQSRGRTHGEMKVAR
jgi:hypothetical protein